MCGRRAGTADRGRSQKVGAGGTAASASLLGNQHLRHLGATRIVGIDHVVARPAQREAAQQLVIRRHLEGLAHGAGPGAERAFGAGAEAARLRREHQRLQEDAGVEHGIGAEFPSHEDEEHHGSAEEFPVAAHLAVAGRVVSAANAESGIQPEAGRAAARRQFRRVLETRIEVAVRQGLAARQECRDPAQHAAGLQLHRGVKAGQQLFLEPVLQTAAGDGDFVGLGVRPARRPARVVEDGGNQFRRHFPVGKVADAAPLAQQAGQDFGIGAIGHRQL